MQRVNREKLFSLSHNTRSWGHLPKLKGGRFRVDKRKYFFTQYILNLWNLLKQCAEGFKRRVDKFMEDWAVRLDYQL